jgi:Cof subfamily protein (haloacid dehalogenase superfamily)
LRGYSSITSAYYILGLPESSRYLPRSNSIRVNPCRSVAGLFGVSDVRIPAVTSPPIRLLAIDIDGTLLDSQFQISAANLAALRRADALGIEVLLTTGRRHTFAMPVAQALGFDLWLVSSNGAITRSSKGELFHRDLLPANVARRLLAHMRDFHRHAVLTFDVEARGALVVESTHELNGSIARWMEKNAAYIQQVVPLAGALVADPVQAMFCGNIALMQQAEARLASSGSLLDEITILKTQYEARDLCILDVLSRECSKGHALRRWASHRGFAREQVMAIGDNYNDVEMLEFAGVPVIMGNACQELKQNSWQVTASNDQSGVAAALEQAGI